MGRKKKQSLSSNLFYLPQELNSQILSHLPLKSLVQLRCVSKSWCSLIDDPNFISLHFTHFNKNPNLLILDHVPSCSKLRCLIRKSSNFRKINEIELKIQENESYSIVGYINGLLTLMKIVSSDLGWKFYGIIVWNISMRRYVELPTTPFSYMSKATLVEPGFGFRGRNEGYIVVLIVYPGMKMCDARVRVLVEVYDSRVGLWRRLGFDVPCLRCLGPSVFVDGGVHWLGCDMRLIPWMGKSSHVVSFDVGGEVFGYKKLPEVEEGDLLRERLVMVFGDCVGLLDMYRDRNYIWVMDKGREVEGWTKMYTIDLHIGRFLCLKEDEELVFATRSEGVQSYNIKNQHKRFLAKTYPEFMVYTDVFVESLMPLKAIGGKELHNLP